MDQLVKKHYLVLLLWTISISSLFAQQVEWNYEVMDDALEDKISNDASAYLSVYVVLKDQVDIAQLEREFESLRASKHQRAKTLVTSLKEKARLTQTGLLDEFYRSAQVKNESIHPFWVTNLIKIEAEGYYLAQLSFHPQVQRIEQEVMPSLYGTKKGSDLGVLPSIPNGREEGLTTIQAHKLWELGYTGYGTKVMVVDTEIDFSHRALRTQFLYNNAPLEETFSGDTPFEVEFDGSVCANHGTWVTGLIVGLDRTQNDTVGGAFNAKYISGPVPFFDEDGNVCEAAGRTLGPIQNLQYALDPDGNSNTSDDIPDVINNSYGTSNFSTRDCQSITFRNIFSSLNAAGVSLVYASGNEGPDESTISLQTSFNFDPLVPLSVGAVDDNNVIASFSSRGPSICIDGPDRFEPEVVAPGAFVRTTEPLNLYDEVPGTSFSTPYVAGALLLLKEAFPNLGGKQLTEAIYTTARDLGPEGEDNTYGNGLINVFAAYNWLIEQGNNPTPPLQSSNDVILVDAVSKNVDCGRMVQSFVTVANNGSETITSMQLDFKDLENGINMGNSTWNGELLPGEMITFQTDPVNAFEGRYTIEIEVSQINGRVDLRSLDNVLKLEVNVTNDLLDPELSIAGDQICKGGQSMLQASTPRGGTIRWYDAFQGGNIIAEGDSLLISDIEKDTTVYVTVTTPNHLGLERADVGPNTFLSQRGGLVFDALSSFKLKSVKIFAESTGPRIIQLKPKTGAVQQRVIPISKTGENRVSLDFDVVPGEDYELLLTLGGGLSVTTNQTGFPHIIDDIVSINRSTGTVATFYAYFYDWEIEYDYFCGRIAANIEVNEDGVAPEVDFTVSEETIMIDENGQAVVQFSPISNDNLVSYEWSFGDGFTSILENPSTVYTEPGNYVVTLYGTNADGCSNMAVKIITVLPAVVSTREQEEIKAQIGLFPNPVQEELSVLFALEQAEEVQYELVDILGKTLQRGNLGRQASTQARINVSNLPAGTYLMKLKVGEVSIGKRFIKN